MKNLCVKCWWNWLQVKQLNCRLHKLILWQEFLFFNGSFKQKSLSQVCHFFNKFVNEFFNLLLKIFLIIYVLLKKIIKMKNLNALLQFMTYNQYRLKNFVALYVIKYWHICWFSSYCQTWANDHFRIATPCLQWTLFWVHFSKSIE